MVSWGGGHYPACPSLTHLEMAVWKPSTLVFTAVTRSSTFSWGQRETGVEWGGVGQE